MSDVQVTQEDREAAWPFRAVCYGRGDFVRWMSGKYDLVPIIQAFARHRLTTRPALDVEGLVEKVARAIMEAKGGCEVKDWKVEARDNPHVALAVKQATAALAAIKDATDAL